MGQDVLSHIQNVYECMGGYGYSNVQLSKLKLGFSVPRLEFEADYITVEPPYTTSQNGYEDIMEKGITHTTATLAM